MMLLSSFWDQFLQSLEKTRIEKKETSPSLIYSLLKQLRPIDLSEEKVILGCNNPTVRSFLEKKIPEIQDVLSRYLEKKMKVELTVIEVKKTEKKTPLLNYQPALSDVLYKTGLHVKYSFDNFAVSSTNQVAYAASQAVTNGLGHTYNPLFLYGGVGVGKTHLAQSVGRKILEQDQEKKVLFGPADQFINELIESIREKSTAKFRRKYRRLDLLIMDDVQFLGGKQAVQEEFFHTFNSIISSGGQVILTSDRQPFEIKGLEDRLRSRFSGGLIIDIQPPDFELKTAILLIKAKEKNIELDIEAAKIIADQVDDTRALEGTLLSLYSRVIGGRERIDLELVERFFSKKQESAVKKVIPQDIVKAICSFYNIRVSHLRGESRIVSVVLPRQITMYILRNFLKMRLEEIAYLLKRKDHTTVIHAVDKISNLMMKDALVKKEVDQIIQTLNLST